MTAPLVVTPGDPLGIGAEVACRALAERARAGSPVSAVLVGDGAAIRRAAAEEGLEIVAVDAVGPTPGVGWLDPGDDVEPVEVASVRLGVGAVLRGEGRALVTGPIHKATLAARGFPYAGHTDFLGALCGEPEPVMAFAGGRLMVALVTVHLPLARVPDAVTTERVLHVVRTADAALRRDLRMQRPRLVVCGLNPHAGEDGLLGTEDRDRIAPAVAAARALGVEAVGPLSAEAAFRLAASGGADLVVAMYHDQGLAPLKLVDFGRSVNWTLGLPIVRTSVDHGTARDIAWSRSADASGMHAAIAFAERLTPSR